MPVKHVFKSLWTLFFVKNAFPWFLIPSSPHPRTPNPIIARLSRVTSSQDTDRSRNGQKLLLSFFLRCLFFLEVEHNIRQPLASASLGVVPADFVVHTCASCSVASITSHLDVRGNSTVSIASSGDAMKRLPWRAREDESVKPLSCRVTNQYHLRYCSRFIFYKTDAILVCNVDLHHCQKLAYFCYFSIIFFLETY